MSLIYDLSQIRGRSGQTFAFQLLTEDLDFGYHGWTLIGPAEFSGTMKVSAYTIELEGQIKAKVEGKCGRCLKPLIYEVDFPVVETMLFQGDTGRIDTSKMEFGELGEKYWIYDKLVYDFTPLVLDYILNELPLVAVCAEACETAGVKETKSEETDFNMDPRWAKLAQLKQDGEV